MKQFWQIFCIKVWILGICAGLGFGPVLAQSSITTPNSTQVEAWLYADQGLVEGKTVWLGLDLQLPKGYHTYWRNPGDSGLPLQVELLAPPQLVVPPLDMTQAWWPIPEKEQAGSIVTYVFKEHLSWALPLVLPVGFQADKLKDWQFTVQWLICKIECIPEQATLAFPSQITSKAKTTWAKLKALQAQRVNASSTASFDKNFLQLTLSGLPAHFQHQRLQVFPVKENLLLSLTDEHPSSQQSWQNATWSARLPLAEFRTDSPQFIDLMLVDQQTPVQVRVPIETPWPVVAQAGSGESTQSSQALAPLERTATDYWGIVFFSLAAFLGGLLLNLMPCVLPVLGIKVSGLMARQSTLGGGSVPRRALGWSYALGVVLSILALGGSLILLRNWGSDWSWGYQLQSANFIFLLIILFALITFNLLDLLAMPAFIQRIQVNTGNSSDLVKEFVTGVFAVLVASPCTGPFMGAALGLALTQAGWSGLWIFLGLGLGYALPYFLLCNFPKLLQWMPKPGAWMLVLRQLLAFFAVASMIWLLWILGRQQGLDLVIYVLIFLLLLGLQVWCWKVAQNYRLVWNGVILGVLAVVFWQIVTYQQPSARATAEGKWESWSVTRVQQLIDQKQTIFVDFTADWCITCQVNKKWVLESRALQDIFTQQKVVPLRADWTKADKAISNTLTALGRAGVPTYLLYRDQCKTVILPEILTVEIVARALRSECQ